MSYLGFQAGRTPCRVLRDVSLPKQATGELRIGVWGTKPIKVMEGKRIMLVILSALLVCRWVALEKRGELRSRSRRRHRRNGLGTGRGPAGPDGPGPGGPGAGGPGAGACASARSA